jgi:hypothetical protein
VTLAPVLLAPDNFTQPARTPWGGRRIMQQYKAHLGLPAELHALPVGESWELSLGPELPSRSDTGEALPAIIARAPHEFLGDEAGDGGSALLVKWLDTADNLSVQIHPDLTDEKLAPDETGKPECWYIVDREPGAGLYVGLEPQTTSERMRAALESGGDVSSLLSFVAVEAGDFFVLAPGMPHAIGRNVTLIEPQYVACGKRGLTLRYWDWNRRYDAQGRQDDAGLPRPLQVERALEVTDWARSSDPSWLARQRCSLGPAAPGRRSARAVQVPTCGTHQRPRPAALAPLANPDGPDRDRRRDRAQRCIRPVVRATRPQRRTAGPGRFRVRAARGACAAQLGRRAPRVSFGALGRPGVRHR